MNRPRNPYANTKKRKAALAFLAARGITQPKPVYPLPPSERRHIQIIVTPSRLRAVS